MPEENIGFWAKYGVWIVISVVGSIGAIVIIWMTGTVGKSLTWLVRLVWHRKPQPSQEGGFPFDYATSFSDLEDRIGELAPNLHGDLSIAYQDRLPSEGQQQLQEQVDSSRFLLLVGRTGIGKTREGIEALRRLEKRVGEPIAVLFPKTPFTGSFDLPVDARRNHIVLFIDNLHEPPYYTARKEGAATAGDFPTWFGECLEHFSEYADFRVIATIRDDLDMRDYEETVRNLRPAFKKFGFTEVHLPPWHQVVQVVLVPGWQVPGMSRYPTMPEESWPVAAPPKAHPTTYTWRPLLLTKERR